MPVINPAYTSPAIMLSPPGIDPLPATSFCTHCPTWASTSCFDWQLTTSLTRIPTSLCPFPNFHRGMLQLSGGKLQTSSRSAESGLQAPASTSFDLRFELAMLIKRTCKSCRTLHVLSIPSLSLPLPQPAPLLETNPTPRKHFTICILGAAANRAMAEANVDDVCHHRSAHPL
ncbi:hypothetical protein IQ07DRAFT_344959 [Pyrenochaeta sp. DS3sAY3a]|nr:hypothetical protein IQ07DRAFT_344959 [Pyrenochaeta sp. DS3sAY3a]